MVFCLEGQPWLNVGGASGLRGLDEVWLREGRTNRAKCGNLLKKARRRGCQPGMKGEGITREERSHLDPGRNHPLGTDKHRHDLKGDG